MNPSAQSCEIWPQRGIEFRREHRHRGVDPKFRDLSAAQGLASANGLVVQTYDESYSKPHVLGKGPWYPLQGEAVESR
jgi:hypothetical protein